MPQKRKAQIEALLKGELSSGPQISEFEMFKRNLDEVAGFDTYEGLPETPREAQERALKAILGVGGEVLGLADPADLVTSKAARELAEKLGLGETGQTLAELIGGAVSGLGAGDIGRGVKAAQIFGGGLPGWAVKKLGRAPSLRGQAAETLEAFRLGATPKGGFRKGLQADIKRGAALSEEMPEAYKGSLGLYQTTAKPEELKKIIEKQTEDVFDAVAELRAKGLKKEADNLLNWHNRHSREIVKKNPSAIDISDPESLPHEFTHAAQTGGTGFTRPIGMKPGGPIPKGARSNPALQEALMREGGYPRSWGGVPIEQEAYRVESLTRARPKSLQYPMTREGAFGPITPQEAREFNERFGLLPESLFGALQQK